MAGTAAGAAKATAARRAAAAARRERAALVGQVTANEQPTSDVGPTDAGPMTGIQPFVDRSAAVPVSGQAVDLLLPDSVDLVGKAIRGQIRVPAAVRVSAALRIIELAQKPGGQGAAVPPGVEGALAALGKAFALRQRTLDASDARVVSVVPDPSPQS